MARKPTARKKIEDIGEKIGGARKDLSSGRKPRAKSATPKAPKLPPWERDFVVAQSLASDGYTRKEAGKWYIHEKPKKKSRFLGRPLNAEGFATEAEARKYLPVAAVAKKHSVVGVDATGRPTYKDPASYEIWRKVTDQKRIKVVGESFASKDAASRYLAQNAKQIIEIKTNFGEEILAKPKLVKGVAPRVGPKRRPGDITPKGLHEAFGFRGVEFGNWNSQPERQAVMNSAYDALRDLNKVTGLRPKELGLKGELGLAFGARGHGLSGAKAHYERDFGAINLTKMQGAGSLAHEWWHSLDHMLGREDAGIVGRTGTRAGHAVFEAGARETDYASHRVYGRGGRAGLPENVRNAHKALIDAMFYKQEIVPSDTEGPKKFLDAAQKSLEERLAGIRKELGQKLSYGKRNTKPATPEQLAKFDKFAAELMTDPKPVEWRRVDGKKAYGNYRWTNDAIEGISGVMKEVRGTSGFYKSGGPMNYLAGSVKTLENRAAVLKDAASSATKVKNVPTMYSMQARRIDEGRVSDYWQTRHEMSARAFAAYVEDKLGARKHASTFLAFGSSNDRIEYRIMGIKPFPEGAERAAINQKFDALFAEVKKSGILGVPGTQRKGLAKFPVGWSDAARVAAAEARGVALPGEAKPVEAKPKKAPRRAKKTGVETLNITLKDRGVISYTVRHDAKVDPFKFKTTKHINVGYGDDGYPIAKIVHANTKKEFMRQIKAAEKAIAAGPKPAATAAAELKTRAGEFEVYKTGDKAFEVRDGKGKVIGKKKNIGEASGLARREYHKVKGDVDLPKANAASSRAAQKPNVPTDIRVATQSTANLRKAAKSAGIANAKTLSRAMLVKMRQAGKFALPWITPAIGVGVGVYALTRGATPAQAAYEGADAIAGGALSDYGQHRKQGSNVLEATAGAAAQYATFGMISAEHFAKTAAVREKTQTTVRNRQIRRQAMSRATAAPTADGMTDAYYRMQKTSRGTRRVKVSGYRTPDPR